MPKKVLKYIIVIAVLITVSFSYGYLKTFLSLKEPNNTNTERVEHNVAGVSEIKLNPGAKLIYITRYIKCNDEIKQEETIDEELIGYTRDEFEKIKKDWKVINFMPHEVQLVKEIDDICDNHYYIGIQDGYVALFQGIPGIKAILVEKTDIIADTLREDDRLILEKGLTIKDQEEFLKIREGLAK